MKTAPKMSYFAAESTNHTPLAHEGIETNYNVECEKGGTLEMILE